MGRETAGVPTDELIISAARRLDRPAVEQVLSGSYPSVHRMAYALIGEPAAAARLVRFILRRSVRVMPSWRKGVIPENWFYHHTLLSAREATGRLRLGESKRPSDPLITSGTPTDPQYVGFVRALRGLPQQQMEAFVLHHGEKLNARLLGVAMDCSTGAAGNHLLAATDALKSLTGDDYARLLTELERGYAVLTPVATAISADVRQQVSAAVWGKRVRRLVRRLILLVLLGATAYAVWRWRPLLLQWFQNIRQRVMNRPA